MRSLLPLLAACAPAPGDAPTDDTDPAYVFEAFDGTSSDPLTTRLCADVGPTDDPTRITCAVEGGPLPGAPGPADPFVMVWNLERGQRIEAQLAAWDSGDLPVPDVLIASELDRGCSRSGGGHVTRQVAEALGMAWVFGVEFVELPRTGGSGGVIEAPCEHGNAILARYPIGNVRWGIHEANDGWYDPEDVGGEGEPRYGGRSWVEADLDLGDGFVKVISVHYESRVAANAIQVAQGAETAAQAAASPIPVLVGGDTNAPLYTGDVFGGTTSDPTDRTIAALVDAGLVDAHAPLPAEERPTRSGLVIDLLLGRDVTFTDPGVCPGDVCDDLSDHRAVWATVSPAP